MSVLSSVAATFCFFRRRMLMGMASGIRRTDSAHQVPCQPTGGLTPLLLIRPARSVGFRLIGMVLDADRPAHFWFGHIGKIMIDVVRTNVSIAKLSQKRL